METLEQPELREPAPHRAIILKNKTCVYCGVALTTSSDTKEHVVGRRFVPKGKLDGHWNLITRACRHCNNEKSDLEDDISAITLQADAWGQHVAADPDRDVDAIRKGERCTSRATGKIVKESNEQIDIELPFGSGAMMSFSATSPPRVDNERAFKLCRYHTTAFFYWITYNEESRHGGFWPGDFSPLLLAVRSDWGNPLHRGFMDAVCEWPVRVLGTTGSGYFKIAIRRHPSEICWSWALEWNANFRIVGFFGQHAVAQQLVDTFPPLEWRTIQRGREITRFREEIRLAEKDDRLFGCSSPSLATG
ncbi:MAG: HNH endonuclease [Verrucomicrobiota bacterium]|nr:HNH endonuclease [Verrucomicrobiota bacterium]